jgi:hypothetical protein
MTSMSGLKVTKGAHRHHNSMPCNICRCRVYITTQNNSLRWMSTARTSEYFVVLQEGKMAWRACTNEKWSCFVCTKALIGTIRLASQRDEMTNNFMK